MCNSKKGNKQALKMEVILLARNRKIQVKLVSSLLNGHYIYLFAIQDVVNHFAYQTAQKEVHARFTTIITVIRNDNKGQSCVEHYIAAVLEILERLICLVLAAFNHVSKWRLCLSTMLLTQSRMGA